MRSGCPGKRSKGGEGKDVGSALFFIVLPPQNKPNRLYKMTVHEGNSSAWETFLYQRCSQGEVPGDPEPPLTSRSFLVSIFRATSLRYLSLTKHLFVILTPPPPLPPLKNASYAPVYFF